MRTFYPYFLIAFGASLWGLIAVFVKGLSNLGFTEMEVVTIRVVFASLFLLLIGGLKYRDQLIIHIKKLPLFIGTGIFSIVFFNWCYFTAINKLNISLAVILLYTSPAFVAILSFLFLRESIHTKKVAAVGGTILGCMLIAGISNAKSATFTLEGLLIGLGAGLGYALYSIFGKFALRHYKPFTVTLYTFLVAAIVLLPFSSIWGKIDRVFTGEVILYGAGLGLIPTVLAYFVYTWGLEKTESSKAAIIATVEPVVATLIGILVYNEKIGVGQLIGSLLILCSVIFVNIPDRKNVLTANRGRKSPNSIS